MRLRLSLHLFACIVAASYLTLGVAATDLAERWWWAYALVTLALAVTNLDLERRAHE